MASRKRANSLIQEKGLTQSKLKSSNSNALETAFLQGSSFPFLCQLSARLISLPIFAICSQNDICCHLPAARFACLMFIASTTYLQLLLFFFGLFHCQRHGSYFLEMGAY